MLSTPSAMILTAQDREEAHEVLARLRARCLSLVLVQTDTGKARGLLTTADLEAATRDLAHCRLSALPVRPIQELPRRATLAELDRALNVPHTEGVLISDHGQVIAAFTRIREEPIRRLPGPFGTSPGPTREAA